MVTRPQPGLERDLDVLRTINREREACVAIGALVARPGRVSVGDVVTPVVGEKLDDWPSSPSVPGMRNEESPAR
jgi:hypothetical protein